MLPSNSRLQEQGVGLKSRFSRPTVYSQLMTPSDGKNPTSAAVINHCPFKYHRLPKVFDCVVL